MQIVGFPMRRLIYKFFYILKHYENLPMQCTEIFISCKNSKSSEENLCYFSYFCLKHRWWVQVRTASVSYEYPLCFGAKIRKIGIPLHTPVLLYKSGVGFKGVFIAWTCFPDGSLNYSLGVQP